MSATGEWREVGDRCFARRYDPFDVTVGVVVGADGLLVIDTRGGRREARELRDDLRALSPAPVRWVLNTHWHFDHTFGNEEFADAVIYGHESVPVVLAERGEAERARLAAEADDGDDVANLRIVPPNRTFASLATIDLGDRSVEIVHPGRGHTDGDVVLRVPDADVVFAGDLVEQSGPPAYGDDSYPLEWPQTLEVLSGLLTPDTSVVPGHGEPCDLEFVRSQHGDILAVAERIRELYRQGVPEEEALAAGDADDGPGGSWPFPADRLAEAVRRGYASLRESGTRPDRPALPIIGPTGS